MAAEPGTDATMYQALLRLFNEASCALPGGMVIAGLLLEYLSDNAPMLVLVSALAGYGIRVIVGPTHRHR